jgi:dTDP-4-amino-4,6-dideoxygalactose transaminase
MVRVPFVDIAAQQGTVEAEVASAVGEVLSAAQFILGPQVAAFERAFADFVEARDAVGVSSGLDALRLALLALEVDQGDEVILPANTYIATALAVSAIGARPVLVDCDRHTYQLAVEQVEAAVTPRTRAVIPVHLTGQAADLDPVQADADRHGLHVIEDAAQAHGARYRGRPCGSIGALGCFSFYPSKNLGACGDAGMVVTGDAALAERVRRLRNYGQTAKYHHAEQGLNARLDTIQAAILLAKLGRLAGWNQARADHAQAYRDRLDGVGDLAFQQMAPSSTHVWHLFVVETARRDALRDHLAAAGVQTGIHYPVPLHLQDAYEGLGHKHGDFPQAELLADRMLSLPMYPELSEEQVDLVTAEIERFFQEAGRS